MYGDRISPELGLAATTGIWTYDLQTRRLWWSAGAFLMHGLPPAAPQPALERVLEYYSEEDRERVRQAFHGGAANGRPWELELDIRGADGRLRRVHVMGEAVLSEGRVIEVAGSYFDVGAERSRQISGEAAAGLAADAAGRALRQRFEEALSAEQALSRVALNAVADGIIRTDVRDRVVYCNEAAQVLGGRELEQMLGRPLAEALDLRGADAADPAGSALRALREANGTPVQLGLAAADGTLRSIEGRIEAVRDRSGLPLGSVFVFRDLTHTQSLARQLKHQSSHDPLTGLPNRGRFEEELAVRLNGVRLYGEVHSVLYLDLDRFTLINDTCGHQEGDRLLQMVARELDERLRPGDLLARVGDDKFAAILGGCGAEHALDKAAALVEVIGGARFRVGERSFQLTLSAGVTAIEPGIEHSRQLLIQADTACYVAKRLGGDRAQLYRHSDEEVSRTRSDMDWVPRIEQALDEGRLELYAQRIVPLEGGAPCYELLVRLRDPGGGVVLPGAFLPAAQRFGLMGKIERSVVRQALDKIDRLQRQGANGFGYLSINLSGASLSDDSFTGFLLAELQRLRTPPERVRFEITETSALTETAAARAFIDALHLLGYKILLDDFGTGFTSFGYLKSLGANGLKVDQSFTRNLAGDVINQTIVESICKIGSRLGLEIIAEGVEDQVTLQALRSLGVRHAQGWLFHRPEPLERVLQ
jgi:diguanylate cyclase (GGDEF)-like protein/PAS domain S-box-containing protein